MISQQKQQKKVCLVTVGATASFDTLINAVLSDSFLGKLQQQQYTDLVLQHGKNGEHLVSKHETLPWLQHGITLRAFDINPKGLMEEMRWAKGAEIRAKGVVISHAGSGSILDALRVKVPLIVVPNPDLLDDHQTELAVELAKQGYVIHGTLGNLPAAIEEVESLREKQKGWPPRHNPHDPSGRGFVGILDDEMGFID